MPQHVIFAAPYFMNSTLRFIDGATHLPGVELTVISQDPVERIPNDIRQRIAGHSQVDDVLDPERLASAARQLEKKFGKATRMIGGLDQLQVSIAVARELLGIEGLSADAARNFRDKSRMKLALREAGVPCARHVLVNDRQVAASFAAEVGFPIVVKPPPGAGGKSTFRLDNVTDLKAFLKRFPPDPESPAMYEEFIHGTEYSFDSVVIHGKPAWHSISRYMPSPLEVLENDWIQWCVMLPRDVSGSEFDPIRKAAFDGVDALGLKTGFSHTEWFRLHDGGIAISEVGSRPPGAQFTSLMSWAHDINFYRAWPRLMVFDEFQPPPRRYAAGAAYIRGQGRSRVKRITGLDEAQQRYGSLIVEAKLPKEGQPPTDSYEGDGYIIVRHPETHVVENALQQIVQLIRVHLG